MNTVDELIRKLQAVSDAGHGDVAVILEGCDCVNDWDGDEPFEVHDMHTGKVHAVQLGCTQ